MNVKLVKNWQRWSALRPMVARMPTIFHSFSTTWWTCTRLHLYRQRDTGLPCDPRSSVLMECDVPGFLQEAESDPTRYGKHGLDALAAAFHGSIVVKSGDKAGLPTCLESWDLVNQLIDEEMP